MSDFSKRIGPAFMDWLLKSPLHPMMSSSTLMLYFLGRKSGKQYAVPVNYVRAGDQILITSRKNRTWWRNLRGGCSIQMVLQGQAVSGRAVVLEDEPAVVQGLAEYLGHYPKYARYFGVGLDEKSCPKLEDLQKAAVSRVVVRVDEG